LSVGRIAASPQFSVIKEGVNLLHVVAQSQTDRRELLAVGLMPCQAGLPDAEERVANLVPEGIDLRCVIAPASDRRMKCR
jgi:hypothetical protein